MRNELEAAMIILGKGIKINPDYEQKSKTYPIFGKSFRKDP